MDMNNKFVAPEDISTKIEKKENLYEVFRVDRKYSDIFIYIEPISSSKRELLTEFFKDILSKIKLFANLIFNQTFNSLYYIKRKHASIYKYRELGVNPIWSYMKKYLRYFSTFIQRKKMTC